MSRGVAGRVLVHIGTAKTGTSSIQRALARAEVCGSLRPVRYPMFDGGGSHAGLATLYLTYQRLTRYARAQFPADDSRLAAMRRRYRRRLFDALRTTDRAILSSENLTRLSANEAGRLRRDLEDAGFGEFRVVLYVRDAADYYLSQIQQHLKVSSRVASPVSFRYPFRRVAEAWEEAFSGSVVVRAFSGGSDFDVLQDFSALTQEFLGVGLAPASERANSTISAEGMEILQRYRSTFWSDRDDVFTPDTTRLVEFLQRSVTTVPQTRPELRPEIAAWIRASHREDFAFIEDRYGVDLGADCADTRQPPRIDEANLAVADVLRCVDPQKATELLPGIAKEGLDMGPPKRPLPVRIACRLSRMYQSARQSRW